MSLKLHKPGQLGTAVGAAAAALPRQSENQSAGTWEHHGSLPIKNLKKPCPSQLYVFTTDNRRILNWLKAVFRDASTP